MRKLKYHVEVIRNQHAGRKALLVKLPRGMRSLNKEYTLLLIATAEFKEQKVIVNRPEFRLRKDLTQEEVWKIFGIDRRENSPKQAKAWTQWASGIMLELGYYPNSTHNNLSEYFANGTY